MKCHSCGDSGKRRYWGFVFCELCWWHEGLKTNRKLALVRVNEVLAEYGVDPIGTT